MAGALAICVIGGGTYYYMHTNTTQTKAQYYNLVNEKGTVKTLISATGTINPVNYVDVSTSVAGKLESVLVKKMTKLRRGQVIAYLDMRSMQTTVDRAKSAMDNTEKDMNRYATLGTRCHCSSNL